MIEFTTINVDGIRVTRQFRSCEEILTCWWESEMNDLPASDDNIVDFRIDGEQVRLQEGEIFASIITYIEQRFWSKVLNESDRQQKD